jgi:hypothetical protein
MAVDRPPHRRTIYAKDRLETNRVVGKIHTMILMRLDILYAKIKV